MNSRVKDLYHLGAKPVARATFADANNMRPASFYQALFEKMYQLCRIVSPKHKFKFKNKLYRLDASVIDLSLGAFPWASFRQLFELKCFVQDKAHIPSMGINSPFCYFYIKYV